MDNTKGWTVEKQVRISCGALCRVVHPDDGRLLLGLNRAQAAQGVRVLKPLGGALTYAADALPSALTFAHENPATHELRLTLPASQVDVFAAWFALRTGRERSPLRELREELVDEYGVLSALHDDDVQVRYLHTVRGQRHTDRPGAAGMLTHSFQEIFAVTWQNAAQWQTLLDAPPSSGLMWVSESDIRAGITPDGVPVQAMTLVTPHP